MRESDTTFPEAEVAQAVGRRPVRWERPAADGYGTNNSRWVVELGDGESVFVKAAAEELREAGVEVGVVFELHGQIRLLDVFDPDGNRLQLAQELSS